MRTDVIKKQVDADTYLSELYKLLNSASTLDDYDCIKAEIERVRQEMIEEAYERAHPEKFGGDV